MNKITIRQILSSDITSVTARQYSLLTSQLSQKEIVIAAKRMTEISEDCFLIGAFAGDDATTLVGSASLVQMKLPQGDRFLLESLVVRSDLRGLSIGNSILQFALELAKFQGAAHVNLTCNPTRPEARKLYKENGFEIADTAVFRHHFAA